MFLMAVLAEGPVWPAVLSNLAGRPDQRPDHIPPPLTSFSIFPSLSPVHSPPAPTLPALGLTLHSLFTNTIATILPSYSLSLSR